VKLKISTLLLIASSLLPFAVLAQPEPEAATGYNEKQAFVGKEYLVSAANPYASWVGKKIIDQGGSAIDAAVAIQAMLTLVEPQSSGIGGGAFLLYWDNKTKQLTTYDGRETAPKAANANLFMQHGKAIPWKEAVTGGRAVGVPGVLKALDMAHQDFGTLPWKDLFSDSIRFAEEGFSVSPRLEKLVSLNIHPGMKQMRSSFGYFYPGNRPLKQGHKLKNKPLAQTLDVIAKQGAQAFYTGELAQTIVKAVRESEVNPGNLSLDDLANYQAVKRNAVCGAYHKYKVCGMAPPSSGGLTVLQILKLLAPYKLEQYQANSLEAVHLFTQASRLAYADRKMYMADSDFNRLPFPKLIGDSYLQKRAEKIDINQDMGRAREGFPFPLSAFSPDNAYELPNTSHFSIVDKQGNAVSMTTSIEHAFGSALMVGGFLLNNQMTDFSFVPQIGKRRVLNRIEPNKRPRSSMSPTMVFDQEGELLITLGSPGGSRIINYVAQTLIGILDWELDIQQAINLPKVTNRNDYTALEKNTQMVTLKAKLEQKGHKVRVHDLNSGLHGIYIDRDKGLLVGGADPRREGVVTGK